MPSSSFAFSMAIRHLHPCSVHGQRRQGDGGVILGPPYWARQGKDALGGLVS